MSDMNSFLWTEKYRAKSVKEVIMPKDFRSFFNKLVKSGDMPNVLLSSSTAGTGKCLDFDELINIKVSKEFYEKHKDLFED